MAGGTSHTPGTIEDLRRALAALAAELDGREEWHALRQLDERERGGDLPHSLDGVLLRGRLVRQLEATSRAWRAYAEIQEAILQLEGPDVLPQQRIAAARNADAALVSGAATGADGLPGHSPAARPAASEAPAEVRRQRVKVRAASLPLAPSPPSQQTCEPAPSMQPPTQPEASACGVSNQAPEPAPSLGASAPAPQVPADRAADRSAERPVTILAPALPDAGPVATVTPARGPSILDRIQTIQAITTRRAPRPEATPTSPSPGLWGARPARAPAPTTDVAAQAGPAEQGSAESTPGAPQDPVDNRSPRAPRASSSAVPPAGSGANAAERLDRVEVEIDNFMDEGAAIWTRPLDKAEIERRRRFRAMDFGANGEDLVPDEAEVTIVRLDHPQVPGPEAGPVSEPEPPGVPVAPAARPARPVQSGDGAAGPRHRQANGVDYDDGIGGSDYAGYRLDVEEADVEIVVVTPASRTSTS